LRDGSDIALLASGTMVLPSLEAADTLARCGVSTTVVNCRFIKPLDEACLARLFPAHGLALTIEEGTMVNGFGAYVRQRIGEAWPQVRVASMGMPDTFVAHGSREEILAEIGLTPAAIAERAAALAGRALTPTLRETA
jgi:1-deoxy-D-xylulose-5-phosphate synthase